MTYEGFAEFVAARQLSLSRIAYLLTGDHHAAQDLVQSSLVKLAGHWRRINASGDPEAYLRQIMVNERNKWWRTTPALTLAELPDLAAPGTDEATAATTRISLATALRTLPPRQRAVIVLRYYADLTEAEIAQAMNTSVGTVKSQAHDALARLRPQLTELAEKANPYGDARGAIRTARRRRTTRAAAIGAAVLVLLLGVVGVWTKVARPTEPPPPPASESPSPSPASSRLVAFDETAPELPADRPVGRAQLILKRPDAMRFNLSLADGTQYRLPPPGGDEGIYPYLSPDGRWLFWQALGGLDIRDLTGTARRTLAGIVFGHWSPNGAWVRAADPRCEETAVSCSQTDLIMHVGDWQTTAAGGRSDSRAWLAILDDGTRLVAPGGPNSQEPTIALEVLGHDGSTLRSITVNAGSVLAPGEHVARWYYLLTMAIGGGGLAAAQLRDADDAPTGAFVAFSLADGSVSGRIDVAPPSDGGSWRLAGFTPENLLVLGSTDDANGFITVEYVDPHSGAVIEILTAAPDALLRPAAWP